MSRANEKILALLAKRVSEKEFRKLYNRLTAHEKDLLNPCSHCGAEVGYDCNGVEQEIVHFSRRLMRFITLPEKLEGPQR